VVGRPHIADRLIERSSRPGVNARASAAWADDDVVDAAVDLPHRFERGEGQ
jgi:hypothetical protein